MPLILPLHLLFMRPTTIIGLLLLGLFWLGQPTELLAQGTATAAPVASLGAITGTVLDSLKKEPVAYATVVLLPAAATDSKPVTGVAADDQGRFTIPKIAAGPYRLQVSYVGYGTQTRAITVAATGDTNVGTFRLPVAAQQLAEAVVIGTKPVVEVRADRLVYNAEQDVTNAGGTAQDVLRKTPLLAVDGEGNVTMRGSGNFRVLINNKPSPTLAQNLKEALKGIPAEQIQSVEVITTPPAKYDGEGTAGIINIVLKKGVNQNVNGRVGAGASNRNSSVDASLNFRKGKIGFTSSGGTGRWYNPSTDDRSRTSYDGNGATLSLLNQHNKMHDDGRWVYGSMGIDYDPAEHHSFSLAGSLNTYKGTNDQQLSNQLKALNTSNNQLFSRATLSRFTGLNTELTGSYTRTFTQARREWSMLGQYADNSMTSGYDFDQYQGSLVPLESGLANYRERARNNAPGHTITAQTDFTQPFGEKQTLEFGLKSIWRRSSSVAEVDTLFTATSSSYGRSAQRGTDFSYDQDVQSAYATYSFKVGKKLNFSLGGRVERTALAADFRTTDTGFSHSYVTPLPNGSAQYAFSEATSLRLAYSRRITRPYIFFLNPYVDRSDPARIQYGNPNLDPELTDSYELGYNTLIKTASINATLSVRHTGNAIEQVRLPTDSVGVTAQTFANVAANTFYQFNLYGSVKLNSKWDLSGGPDVQYIVRRSPALQAERKGFTAGINLNTSYKFSKTFSVQSFVFGSLPSPEIQGRGPANLYYQFGAKKSFLKERLDLTVNLMNPFNDYWAYRGTLNTPYFSEQGEYRSFQRAFRMYVAYRFGQEKGGRQRKSIRNDDVKGGGSKQGG
jgi:outer membrane receptor protein involved in Fe transport